MSIPEIPDAPAAPRDEITRRLDVIIGQLETLIGVFGIPPESDEDGNPPAQELSAEPRVVFNGSGN